MPSTESRPTPDPTILTTEQLLRELGSLRDTVNARMDGMDDVRNIMREQLAGRQDTVDRAVNHLEALHNEKFRSIATQFSERDTRTEQTSRDSKVAVDAALQAAKEAVGEQNKSNALANSKMETAFTKQIDQLGQLVNTMTAGLNDKIDDLKTRVTASEGLKSGSGTTGTIVLNVVMAVIAVGAVVVAVIALRH